MLKNIYVKVRDFFVAYPAVLSGYIIYMYFFFSTLDFYQQLRHRTLHGSDAFKTFDALIWMWLLSLALVKVIQYRERLHTATKVRTEREQQLAIQQSQLDTIQQITRALQHQINNPLTIIYAYTQKAQRKAKEDEELVRWLSEVKTGAERINQALKDYAESTKAITVQTPVGDMMVPEARS